MNIHEEDLFDNWANFIIHLIPLKSSLQKNNDWAVVVTQLAGQVLWTGEIRSSNPVIGKLYKTYTMSTVLKRQK